MPHCYVTPLKMTYKYLYIKELVDIEPETWNQIADAIEGWAVIFKQRENSFRI